MARSTLQKEGEIVTDDGIIGGQSESYPPLADTFGILIFLERHLVAVEYNSVLLNSHFWRDVFVQINTKAAASLGFSSFASLEPVPATEKMTTIVKSFEKLIRLKVAVRIPNPELDKWTQKLHDEMKKNGIREYLQDMKNKNGLNTDAGMRPHTTMRMAEAGYKDGEVVMAGLINGKFETVRTGQDALSIVSKIPKSVFHEILLRPHEYQFLLLIQRVSELINETYKVER